ncbi:aspartate ammonia-lyase [Enterovibrio norvegicus FF-33]|uniref:class II fumarate hydratase n=1 Tax=Enterovibrio norvegicus TaxID=188144 RepID=UPI0003076452|nr:class II fumarate hydratase [Enterovibrio norvegicus]OEE66575.1 aspartate ammonia-lyase [Enterovibrio norvegicus FF-33]
MNTEEVRVEHDSMGDVEVPKNMLYQAQTQRAVNNFTVSGREMPAPFIRALAMVKYCAASVNSSLSLLDAQIAEAITESCEEISAGEYLNHFPVDVFQTGSGTSSNMNMNEVVATLATIKCGIDISPNDHVNMSQSSNDAVPTAIQISAVLECENRLLPALDILTSTLVDKEAEVGHIVKTGRTHLMDAMPVTFGQELEAWRRQMTCCQRGITFALEEVRKLAQGGTAVGTGINAHPQFASLFATEITAFTGTRFEPHSHPFNVMGSQDALVGLSGQLRNLAVAVMKISNDLRWMNSGPLAGLGEIELESLQPGSSIMPGKVNPVIPESSAMVAAQVMGNDVTIGIAGQSGNFELNVMLPLIADNLLDSIHLMANALNLLATKAIATFKVREDRVGAALEKNPILVTALNPVIGYLKAADIAKKAYNENRAIIAVALEETDLTREQLDALLDPAALTRGGIADK